MYLLLKVVMTTYVIVGVLVLFAMLGHNRSNHYSYIALIGTLVWQCMHWLTSNHGERILNTD